MEKEWITKSGCGKLHQQTLPKLLTLWLTHCYNTVNNVVKFDMSISTILLPYMITILLYTIVKITNIVTIFWDILTIWWHNIVIIYGNNIVEIDNMVNNMTS